MMEDAAIKLLSNAVKLDKKGRLTEAKIYYLEGIQLLCDYSKTIDYKDDKKKTHYKAFIAKYLTRAEEIQKQVEEQCTQGIYHEQITIEHNSVGHSYESLFGRLFDGKVTEVEVEDPYIRSYHQRHNFLRFCEMAVKKCLNLKSIKLVTFEDSSKDGEQTKWLREFKAEMKSKHNINLIYEFSSTLHDRQIKLSSGWMIKIGRGLDYFKAPETKCSLGYYDLDLRPCHETVVDIYHEKDVHTRKN